MSRYIVGITGASGSIYAVRLLGELLQKNHEVHLIITHNGLKVLNFEMEYDIDELRKLTNLGGKLHIHSVDDLFATVASGSYIFDGMAVIPCSMSTMGEIAGGVSKNLLGRAADVCIKEKRRLVLVPRETPLSIIHLKNMVALCEAGATVLPAMPAFYNKPRQIDDMVDFIVGKVLDSFGIENNLYSKWGI